MFLMPKGIVGSMLQFAASRREAAKAAGKTPSQVQRPSS
jgi:hypothetical protein